MSLYHLLRRTERELFGTNDWEEIRIASMRMMKQEVLDSLTGMEEEQADWESDEEDFRTS